MRARAVIFDFGGVLTTCATPFRVREIVEAKGLPWEAVLHGFQTFRRDYDIGDLTVGEFYDRVWREAGLTVDAETRAAIEEADTASFLYPNARTLLWMRDLKRRGYRIGILTNMPRELAPRFRACFAEYTSLADAITVSCEERLVKPMRAIYDLTAERIGVPAEDIVFVDDSEMNCRGAEEAGWKTVRFVTNEQAERALERLLQEI